MATRAGPTVAVLGAGKLAEAVTQLLVPAVGGVRLWARRTDVAKKVAHGALVCDSVADACRGAQLVCFAVPTHALPEVARAAGEVTTGDMMALHACRGVALDNQQQLSWPHEVIKRETCLKKVIALGGPLYVEDAALGRPLAAVAASRFDECLRAVAALVRETRVRLHGTRDVIGVEVAGAVSNVSIIAAGIAQGAGLGETDQGILLTRGLYESQLIGRALGAEAATFAGLAGVGDLIPRKVTSTRRHKELGEALGREGHRDKILAAHQDLEGPRSASALALLAERLGIEVPLVRAVNDVLTGRTQPAAALERLLKLDLDLRVA